MVPVYYAEVKEDGHYLQENGLPHNVLWGDGVVFLGAGIPLNLSTGGNFISNSVISEN